VGKGDEMVKGGGYAGKGGGYRSVNNII